MPARKSRSHRYTQLLSTISGTFKPRSFAKQTSSTHGPYRQTVEPRHREPTEAEIARWAVPIEMLQHDSTAKRWLRQAFFP